MSGAEGEDTRTLTPASRAAGETPPEQHVLELRALQRVAATGARALDLEVVLDRCLEQALEVAHIDAGVIYLRDERRGIYTRVRVSQLPDEVAPPLLALGGLDSRMGVQHSSVLIELGQPRAGQERAPSQHFAALGLGFRHALLLPLRVEQRLVGVVALLFPTPAQLAQSTVETLEAIAGFEAVAIANASVHRELELRAGLANLLRHFGEQVLATTEHDLPSLILQSALAVTRGDRAFLSSFIRDEHGARMRVDHGVGKDAELVGHELALSARHLAESVRKSGPTVVEDTAELDPESEVGAVTRRLGTASFVLMTLRLRGVPVGQLFAGAGAPRAYSEAEIEAMQILASMSAEALERERVQREIAAERARLDSILEHLPLVVAVLSRDGRTVHVNEAGRRFADSLMPGENDWRTMMARMRQLDRDGKPIAREDLPMFQAFAGRTPPPCEMILNDEHGKRIASVLALAVPLREPSGAVESVVVAFQDVTQLRELADAKDRFLSIASHELRSPITSLRATTTLLELDPSAASDPERRATMLARIQRQAQRLTTLMDRLLDTARLNAREVPLDLQDCDLVTLARDAVELQRLTVPDHRFHFEAPPTLHGHWDPSRIEQVLTNLLGNAVRYSAPGTDVTVRIRGADERALLEVEDQGIGIPPEQRARLFTPFSRGANAAQHHKGGLGLGLYITHEIVRRHGGRMRVTSEVGRGTTFVVELPRRSS